MGARHPGLDRAWGFKKGRTIEATLEQWSARRARPRDPGDRLDGTRT